MNTIMVQMSDKCWTMEAMHLASALARNKGGTVVLLRLVLARNPGLLGWDIDTPTRREAQQMAEYAAIAADYGIDFCVQPMQFVSLADALAQVVVLRRVSVLFAHMPPSPIPFWRQFQLWSLKRQLHACRLYTLDEEQPFSIEMRSAPAIEITPN